jgi:prepilin-type N-terminal cleavage/methylation domain-containing protein
MKNRDGGFTLIEVLLACMLVAAAALLMYSFFGQGFSLYTLESESADEQMNLRQAMSDITNVVRVTDGAKISVSNNVLTVDDRTYKLSATKILRNGTAIASNISTFTVSKSNGLLSIKIVNDKGTAIETSLFVGQPAQ